jgi:hypothetical protein
MGSTSPISTRASTKSGSGPERRPTRARFFPNNRRPFFEIAPAHAAVKKRNRRAQGSAEFSHRHRTDDHFQRGTAVRKITAIWEEFAGASSVSTFNMRSLSFGAN